MLPLVFSGQNNIARVSRFIALFILVLISNNSIAQQKPDTVSVSIGMNLNNYAGQVKRILERYEQEGQYGRTATHIELMGLYWKQDTKGLFLGGSLAADLDGFTTTHVDFYFLKFYLRFSSMYYLIGSKQNGLYLRGDAGITRQLVAGDPVFHPEYHWGLSSLAGLGYSHAVIGKTSLNLQLHYLPSLNAMQYESGLGISLGAVF